MIAVTAGREARSAPGRPGEFRDHRWGVWVTELVEPWGGQAPVSDHAARRGVGLVVPGVRQSGLVISTARRAAVPAVLLGAELAAFALILGLTGSHSLLGGLLWVGLTVGMFSTAGAYRKRLTFSVLTDLPRLSGRVVAASALSLVLSSAWGVSIPLATTIGVTALVVVALLAFRAISYAMIRMLRANGFVSHPTLVIGAGQVGTQIVQVTLDHPEFGIAPVGFLDSRPMISGDDLPVPVVGDVDTLARAIGQSAIEHVIIAFTQSRESDVVGIIRTCDRLDCEIFFVPRLFELSSQAHQMEDLLGIPLVRLRRAAYRTARWRLKRVVDVAVSATALGLLALPMLAIAAALRIAHGPGVLFRQIRIGLDGRSFELLKFRSMRSSSQEEAATRWNIARDDNLDTIGRLLRRSSLDELPQLVNILRGDMSLVGPRPERPHFVAQFGALFPRYVSRHRVPSGLTGWAQVNGLRGDTSIEERARFDNYYIENWSLWLDVRILLRTLTSLLRGS